jgi:hypothetical protein
MTAFLRAILVTAAVVLPACDNPPVAPLIPEKPAEAPTAAEKPVEQASGVAGKSILVVAGLNYEDLSRLPFFIDPVLKAELESAGAAVAECRWPELTWDKLRQFDAVVFLQTPNLPWGEIENGPLFARMQELTARFLEAGGGVLLFPDLFRGRIETAANRWLGPYNIEVTLDELRTPPGLQQPFQAYPALGRTLGRALPGHPATGEGGEVWVPVGTELSFGLNAGDAWTTLLLGPEASWTERTDTSGRQEQSRNDEPPVLAAAREVGPGRLAVLACHSSFWVLNPFHEFWDSGVILKEAAGRDFLLGLIGWLANVPIGSELGGFARGRQDTIDDRADRLESISAQRASFPSGPRRGVIGVEPGEAGMRVAALADEARKLGLDFLVFTPEASQVDNDAAWDAYVEACRRASGDGFRALPGVRFHSEETGNDGLAFNLKKRWPETPWQGTSFETFVRVGVNNDWESIVALVDPSGAPFPYANLGAITAVAFTSPEADASSRPACGELLREAISGGWKLMPLTYRAVTTAQELARAAEDPTFLYVNPWDEKEGDHRRWDLSSTGRGRIKEFSVTADSTWEPPGYSVAGAQAVVEDLPDGAVLELYGWHRLLRRAPAVSGRAETAWEGILPGAGMFWIQAVDADGRTIMQASPLPLAKIAFSAFVGSDMMNGYWYPVRKVAADAKNAVMLGGAYGQLGTSVYPQLGWGGHWQFRTLNQISEPLGFEIGSPPGGLPRMTAGYRWPQGGSLSELAPMRTMGINSTQAVVWNDTGTLMRRDEQVDGRRRLSVAPFPGVSANTLRTTGYDWWDHAVLLFEADVSFDGIVDTAASEANVASALLGDPFERMGPLTVRHNGAEKVHAFEGSVLLPTGAGASLGDRPMGMVSLWALSDDLQLRGTKDGDKPVLSLWQAGQAAAPQRSVSFLMVLSAHHADRSTSLAEVEAWLFDNAVWRSRGSNAAFTETVDLAPSRGEQGSWDVPGKKWRGRLTGLNPDWDAAVLWRTGDRLAWQPLPWSDPQGPLPVLLEKAPEGQAFLGHPIISSEPSVIVTVLPQDGGVGPWKVIAHHPEGSAGTVELKTHPALEGLASSWNVSADFAPGETKSWNYQP